jgi:hypothetical protein
MTLNREISDLTMVESFKRYRGDMTGKAVFILIRGLKLIKKSEGGNPLLFWEIWKANGLGWLESCVLPFDIILELCSNLILLSIT